MDSKRPLRVEWVSDRLYTFLVHHGVIKVAEKTVRQSVSLPPRLAKQVGSMPQLGRWDGLPERVRQHLIVRDREISVPDLNQLRL